MLLGRSATLRAASQNWSPKIPPNLLISFAFFTFFYVLIGKDFLSGGPVRFGFWSGSRRGKPPVREGFEPSGRILA
jgi:hypothetical protein